MPAGGHPVAPAVLVHEPETRSGLGNPVVTLVVEPVRYKFMDFVKVGVPLLLVTCLVTLRLTALVFPYAKTP